MNTCDWLVAAMYILSAAIAMFSVSVRCRALVADVERHCLRRSVFAWYAFRAAVVVVIAGGFLHVRVIAFNLLQAAASKLFA